jgi:hypothetical protein
MTLLSLFFFSPARVRQVFCISKPSAHIDMPSTSPAPSGGPSAGGASRTSPNLLPPLEERECKQIPKISKEQEEQLLNSLFTQAIQKKKDSLAKLEAQVYKYEPPKLISPDDVKASCMRQHDDELERRKTKRAELAQRLRPVVEPKVLPRDAIEDAVNRVYVQQLQMKKDNLSKLKEAQAEADRKLCVPKKLTPEEMQSCGQRLSKPSKRNFTEEEINAICVQQRQS